MPKVWLVRIIQYLGLHFTMTHLINVISCGPFLLYFHFTMTHLINVISCGPFLLYLRFAFCKTMLVHQLRPENKIILQANGRPFYNCCCFLFVCLFFLPKLSALRAFSLPDFTLDDNVFNFENGHQRSHFDRIIFSLSL